MTEIEHDAQDIGTAKEIADTLHMHYPGHLWAVTVDSRQGIIIVKDLSLSGNMGFMLHTKTIYSASQLAHRAMQAGGELLERYRVKRGPVNVEQLSAMPVDFRGRHIFDRG